MAETEWEYETRQATAFDEEGVLAQMGEDGWELIDLGLGNLQFRRTRGAMNVAAWEYERRTSFTNAVNNEMRAQGWESVGQWMTYHYFKRRRL